MVEAAENLAERNSPGDARRGVIRLSPWQERWFQDRARVKVIRAHRQSGKDFEAAAEAVDEAFRTGQDWFIVSITQRQADATFAKARQVAGAFQAVLKRQGELSLSEREYLEYDREIEAEFRCVARTLHLPGGGSVTALPGRDPDTLAGLTGHVILTEFGLFPRGGFEHWRVVFPLITRGFRIIVISTPRGKNTKFFELCQDTTTYSVHTQTILDSVREGFILYDNRGQETDLDTFKRLYGDDAGWRREYLCEFTGDLEALISWALLSEASEEVSGLDALVGGGGGPQFAGLHLEGGAGWQADFWWPLAAAGGRYEAGWDVARTGNVSAVWVNRVERGGVRRLVRLVLMRDCPFALQREVVGGHLSECAGAVGCGDATGLGMDSNETLHTRFGDRWRPATFTPSAKRDLASALVTAFQDRTQRLPPIQGDWKLVHTDLYALQREGDGKDLRLSEGVNPLLAESHCDVAYAAGLARMAVGLVAATPHMWVPA